MHEDLPAAAKGRADRSFKATVPVYFHVVTDGATGAVTGDQIAAQISVLNNTYAGGEGGARSGFTVGQAQRMRDAWLYYRAGA
ncbi:MAG TPA: hypothetical protein VFM54_12855 [Micromonosporaceae bacterium]|nr:hypothetical protein [Micromonosporaceae bacterium]